MSEIKILTGNEAAAIGAKLARPKVVSAYPITPQTQIVEAIAEMHATGEMDCEYIPVESEHSALATLIGSSASGVRCFTATSSQGLIYMSEMLHWAAGARTPIVIVNVNRSLAPPWNIYGDQNDSLSQRDTGLLQFYCESAQEVLDTVIQAFKISEKVGLPSLINLDAFFLSHTAEPVTIPAQETVDQFLPAYHRAVKMDIQRPITFGALEDSERYMELRYEIQAAQLDALNVSKEVDQEFKNSFNRSYGIIDSFLTEDAETILVTSGTITTTAREVVRALREEGHKVGLLKVRLFRPFPLHEVAMALKNAKRVAVLDRNFSYGATGIFAQEIRNALYHLSTRPLVYSYVVGIGGRDVGPEIILNLYEQVLAETTPKVESTWIGLRDLRRADLEIQKYEALPSCELVSAGGRGCPGCGAAWGLDKALQVMGPNTMMAIPACCSTIITGDSPTRMLNVPVYHCGFATAAATATGISRALYSLKQTGTTVLAWAGDGGTFDIGIQALSGAAERGEDIIYICYDNEAYMNTGIQRSGATPFGSATTTTPPAGAKSQIKKDIMAIMAGHNIPYCATASAAFPMDFLTKLERAKSFQGKGLRFIHFYSPCPPGHKIESQKAIELARLAVISQVFPLYEVYNGSDYRITYEPEQVLPVEEYLKPQGRFKHLDEEAMQTIQEMTNKKMSRLRHLADKPD
ncbi:MAG: hypothetical protein HYV97_08150 [Bdellovibrio sp.]|nr:hypothetical protein [Bdellovibrio sp.]